MCSSGETIRPRSRKSRSFSHLPSPLTLVHLFQEVKDQFRKSFETFDAAIQAFEKINDTLNIATIHSHLGRLMRYYAQFYAPVVNGIRQEFSPQERQSYQKAFDYYLRGLKLVENRADLFEVFRNLSWELSNTYFTMATSLQDFAPLTTTSQEDVRRRGVSFDWNH